MSALFAQLKPGTLPLAHSGNRVSTSAALTVAIRIVASPSFHCLLRLVVRTSRCGRDNPGSIPGVDILEMVLSTNGILGIQPDGIKQTGDVHREISVSMWLRSFAGPNPSRHAWVASDRCEWVRPFWKTWYLAANREFLLHFRVPGARCLWRAT